MTSTVMTEGAHLPVLAVRSETNTTTIMHRITSKSIHSTLVVAHCQLMCSAVTTITIIITIGLTRKRPPLQGLPHSTEGRRASHRQVPVNWCTITTTHRVQRITITTIMHRGTTTLLCLLRCCQAKYMMCNLSWMKLPRNLADI